jgi:metal-responsive CopG/Arc/MetJ family transcriptional regulator
MVQFGGVMAVKNISATIDEKILKKLDLVAKDSERNRSWLISKAIEVYLEELDDLRQAKSRLNDERLTSSQLKKELGAS